MLTCSKGAPVEQLGRIFEKLYIILRSHMVKQILSAILFIILLNSCSSLKQLNLSGKRQVASVPVAAPGNSQQKFLDDITVTPQTTSILNETKTDKKETVAGHGYSIEETAVKEEPKLIADNIVAHPSETENISALQLKYAVLLNTDAEQLQNKTLLEGIDEWYGTRYHMGGTTKKGIDCSAFAGVIYAAVFGVTLPRTARDQYRFSRRISRTELQEGDLLFFHTRRGRWISHVGIYLQNNKFVHASTTNGVTISDMFDPYYLKCFVGAGRIDNKQGPLTKH